MVRSLLLALHILLAIMVIGPLTGFGMTIPRLIREGRVDALRYAHKAAGRYGPFAATVLLVGIALVLRQKDDGADFDRAWVSLSMLLFIVAIVNGAVVIDRATDKALVELDAGRDASALAKRIGMLEGINILILITITFLMVDKPTLWN